MWSPYARVAPLVDPGLEVIAIIAYSLSQTLKGGGLRVIYLVEWGRTHLESLWTL